MIERGYRILGWMFVGLGACLPFASIGMHRRGEPISWWEPLALVGASAWVILFGLLFALRNPGPRFKILFLSTWGAALIAFGTVALLLPAEVLVTRGRGPRTIFMAQFRGGGLLVIGIGLIWWAVVLGVRRRQGRTGTPEVTNR